MHQEISNKKKIKQLIKRILLLFPPIRKHVTQKRQELESLQLQLNSQHNIYSALNLALPGNFAVHEDIRMWQSYQYLSDKYSILIENYLNQKKYNEHKGTNKIPRIIWVCWLQGLENAPDIVKACINSIYREMEDYKITVITKDNISEYLDIPDYITEKHQAGIIPNAHFSDYVRTALLVKYGGIWIDSTVLLTQPIPSIIINSELFFFRYAGRVFTVSNWFIASKPGHDVLILMQLLLEHYWTDHDSLVHYFIYHFLVRRVFEYFPDAWNAMPPCASDAAHFLQLSFRKKYDNHMYQHFLSSSFCHKLTYKENYDSTADNYYSHILKTYAYNEWFSIYKKQP